MKRINLKRTLTLLLVGLMLIGMTACSSSQTSTKDKKTDPTSGTPQEITMQLVTWNAEVPVENCTLYKEIEEELNIKLNINWVLAANAQDKINTTLAGGDLPDVMMLLNDTSRTELVQQAGESGMFWDLTEILEDYPLLKENTEPYLRSLTYDGNLIAIPRRTVDRVGGLILREDWLENLNLEMPKTLDDFYNVFYAFTYDDPDGHGVDDTIGLAMAGLDQRALKAASGITAWDYFVDEEAKEVRHCCMEPGYQIYLDFIKKCYDDGIITQDFAAMNAAQGREMFNAGKAGAFLANYANIGVGNAYSPLLTSNPNAKIIGLMEIETPDGSLCNVGSEGFYGMYAFPKSSVKTEEELRSILNFFEYVSQPEMVEKYAFGEEGVHYEYDAEGNFVWLDEAGKNTTYALGIDSTGVASNSILIFKNGLFNHSKEYYEFQFRDDVKNWSSVNTWFVANTDDAAVSTVVQEASTKYVMGEASFADVEKAVQEWLNGGGQSKLDDWTAQYREMIG